jgi:hypothetical protein
MFADELISLHEFPWEVAPFSDRFEGLTASDGYGAARARRNRLHNGGHDRVPESAEQRALVGKDTQVLMHNNWHQLENMPVKYALGTMYFCYPGPADSLLAASPVGLGADHVWGHTDSVDSFLYYSEDLDLYMAVSIDQTQDNLEPILLMMRVMAAAQQRR